MQAVLALLLLLPQSDYDNPDKDIQWARSFEAAYEEARLRNVPVMVFFSSDT